MQMRTDKNFSQSFVNDDGQEAETRKGPKKGMEVDAGVTF